MTLEQANKICAEYGIAIDSDEQLQLLIKITNLPTSDIDKLFNALGIEIAFGSKRKDYLF